MTKLLVKVVLQCLLLASLGLAALSCRPEGPVTPHPQKLGQSSFFQDAVANLTTILNQAVSGNINAGWAVENVSFSLAVVSTDQADPDVPVWEYHHLADRAINGTTTVDRDSQYLIGSISKVISDFVLRKSDLDLDLPVTKWVPELHDKSSFISWDNVSLRALASQLSGTPSNYGFSEYYYLKEYFESLGFPKIENNSYPPCGVISLNKACSAKELINGMLRSYPITAPMERPAYSNVAFTLFIMAVESHTGRNYTQLLNEYLIAPFGLKNTLPSPGDSDKAVIPPVENSWGSDYGINVHGGGLVSSLADLSIFAHAILNRTIMDTPADVRAWLKPHSFAGSTYSFVGEPWEIYRPANLTPAHPHTVTLYAKGGAAYGYSSQFTVIDEYGIALVLLTAGDNTAVTYLYDAMIATFVPAVDAASREQATLNYARTFAAGCDSEQSVWPCINVTVTLDDDSLLLSSVYRNGSDILDGISQLWATTISSFLPVMSSGYRIFPTEDTIPDIWKNQSIVRESWRTWPDFVGSTESDLPGIGISGDNCLVWTIGDWLHYGSEPLDRIVFLRDRETGNVVGLELPFLRSGVLVPV